MASPKPGPGPLSPWASPCASPSSSSACSSSSAILTAASPKVLSLPSSSFSSSSSPVSSSCSSSSSSSSASSDSRQPILEALTKALPDKPQKWAEWAALLSNEGIEYASDLRGFTEPDFAALAVPAVLRVALREIKQNLTATANASAAPPAYDEADAKSAPGVLSTVALPPPSAAPPSTATVSPSTAAAPSTGVASSKTTPASNPIPVVPGGRLTARESGPVGRPWEWYILEGIASDDVLLLEQADKCADVNWNVKVMPMFGREEDVTGFFYQVATFGLKWQIGDAPVDLANRNNKRAAAVRILSLKGRRSRK